PTSQSRARKPSTWSVTPATPNRIPAGHVGESPAFTISAMKTGIIRSRAIVSAFGTWASGAGTARVAMPKGYSHSAVVELGGPVGGSGQIRPARCRAAHAPGAVVGGEAAPRHRGLHLGSLPPLVEARNRHERGVHGESAALHRVVRGSVAARLPHGVLAGAPTLVARADGWGAQQLHRARLGADA